MDETGIVPLWGIYDCSSPTDIGFSLAAVDAAGRLVFLCEEFGEYIWYWDTPSPSPWNGHNRLAERFVVLMLEKPVQADAELRASRSGDKD